MEIGRLICTLHKKMKFPIKDFLSKCDQICRKQRIWSHLLKISLMENFIFLCSGTTNEVADFWLVSINETLWWNGLSYSRLLLTPHFLSCKISSFLYSFTFLIDGNKGIKISFIDENGISHTYFCLHLKKNWLKFQNLAWFAASILICLCTPRFLKILMVKSFNTKDSITWCISFTATAR